MSIRLYNIAKETFEEEKVPAESFMRFLYGNPAGSMLLWGVFKRAFLSRLGGVWANSKMSRKKVASFIANNGIDVNEMLYSPENFKTFNDFFTRALSKTARPVASPENDAAVSFPSDGRHMLIENVSSADAFYVKGQKFDLAKFLGDESLARRFHGGGMLISRLSPVDYHRFHYPVSGQIAARKLINGALFSVSPIALIPRISVFWENKRVLNLIESPSLGMCAFVEIGATNVGTIENFDSPGSDVKRGSPAGLFRLGASCVVTLIPASSKIAWNEKLVQMSRQQIECYAKVGTLAGILSR